MKKLDVPQSGSQGNTTASRNRFGQYNRQRAIPVQPRTAAQLAVRGILSAVSKAWAGITGEQRQAWDTYGTNHPKRDSLGQAIALTGHQSFVAVNSLQLGAGLAILNDPPSGVTPAPVELNVATSTVAGLSLEAVAAIPVTDKIYVFASPPMSAGRSFNGAFRQVAVVTGTNAANQEILDAATLSAKFGTLAAGQKFFFQTKVVRAGVVSAITQTSTVLT